MKREVNIKIISQNSIKAVRFKSAVAIAFIWFFCLLAAVFLLINNKLNYSDTDTVFTSKPQKKLAPVTKDRTRDESYFLVLNNKLLTVTRYTQSAKNQSSSVSDNLNSANSFKETTRVKRPLLIVKSRENNSDFSVMPLPKN